MLPLANLLAAEGRIEEADELYEQASRLGDGHAALNLAIDLHRRGDKARAMQWARRAADLGDERAHEWLRELREIDS